MAREEEVRQEVYYIPENFDDAGGVLGGHFTQRNAIELCVLCGPLAYCEFKFLPLDMKTILMVAILTVIPLAALCAFGIRGESLSQILVAYIRFIRKRRKLSYIEFTEEKEDKGTGPLNFDTVLDTITSKGFKGAMEEFKKNREQAKAEAQEAAENDEDATLEDNDSPKRRKRNAKPANGKKKPAKAHKPGPGRASMRSGMMNSALKEKLLRKLELGDDDEDEYM